MQHSVYDLRKVVTATWELMIAEARCKPAKRTWPEEATSNWPVDLLLKVTSLLYPNNVFIGMREYCELLTADTLDRCLDADAEELEILTRELKRFAAMNEFRHKPPSKEPIMTTPENCKSPTQLIKEYFAKLPQGYPAIKEIKPVLYHTQGDVYLVSFEKAKTPSGSGAQHAVPPPDCKYPLIEGAPPADWKVEPVMVEIEMPNAYAIVTYPRSIKDGVVVADTPVVAGYNEDFWTNADKYRLVLKQHLGMQAIEAAEQETLKNTRPLEDYPDPKELFAGKPLPTVEVPEGHLSAKTVEAIVSKYEELLFKTENETGHAVQQAMAREAELTKQLAEEATARIQAQTKLATIQDILNGKVMGGTKPPETEEEATILMDHEAAGVDEIISANEIHEAAKYNSAYTRADQVNPALHRHMNGSPEAYSVQMVLEQDAAI